VVRLQMTDRLAGLAHGIEFWLAGLGVFLVVW
jgi:hypothetical protein